MSSQREIQMFAHERDRRENTDGYRASRGFNGQTEVLIQVNRHSMDVISLMKP
jgi:hypothetical protein